MEQDEKMLADAFARVCKPSSHYWAFWDCDDLDLGQHYTVEVRFNVPDGDEANFEPISGWTLAHQKSGMVFLRRRQLIDKPAVEGLFMNALEMAIARGWQFHSWQHEPHLRDWAA